MTTMTVASMASISTVSSIPVIGAIPSVCAITAAGNGGYRNKQQNGAWQGSKAEGKEYKS